MFDGMDDPSPIRHKSTSIHREWSKRRAHHVIWIGVGRAALIFSLKKEKVDESCKLSAISIKFGKHIKAKQQPAPPFLSATVSHSLRWCACPGSGTHASGGVEIT